MQLIAVRKDRGAGHILMFVLILVTLLIGALVIDLVRAERVGRTLQRAADAASLAGTLRLQPSTQPQDINAALLGWFDAKRGVFEFLNRNRIFGDSGEISNGPAGSIAQANQDPLEGGNPFSFSEYEFPNLWLKIERGVYFEAGGVRTFVSLEGQQQCMGLPPCQGVPAPSVYQVANATRVTLRLKRLPTILARIPLLSTRFVDHIERTALAAPGLD